MRLIYTLFLITFSFLSYSQYVYKFVKDDLKDLIIFESLLAENRYEELAQYRKERGFSYLNEENKNMYLRFDDLIEFSEGKSNFCASFKFEENLNIEDVSSWKVTLFYQFKESKYDDLKTKLTKRQSDILKSIIYSELDVGLSWGMYKSFLNADKKITDKIIKINDREFKFYNEVKNSYDSYNLSNFTGNSPHINSGLVYFGPPSKYSWLEFGFQSMETNDGLLSTFYSIAYLGKPEDRKKKKKSFKISDIKSHENLNDIIWQKLVYGD